MRRWKKPPENVKEPKSLSVSGRLYQARMWREYAMTYSGFKTSLGEDKEWVEKILRMTRRQCLDMAWLNARVARLKNKMWPSKLGRGEKFDTIKFLHDYNERKWKHVEIDDINKVKDVVEKIYSVHFLPSSGQSD